MERSLHEIFTDVQEETSFAKKARMIPLDLDICCVQPMTMGYDG